MDDIELPPPDVLDTEEGYWSYSARAVRAAIAADRATREIPSAQPTQEPTMQRLGELLGHRNMMLTGSDAKRHMHDGRWLCLRFNSAEKRDQLYALLREIGNTTDPAFAAAPATPSPTQPAREAFDAHLRAMPSWAPEFEVHRPWVEKLLWDAWRAASATTQPPPRCRYCDGTGDVHSITGEWRGTCTECDAAATAHKPSAQASGAS